jgi:GntR family transcriptional regulator
LLRENLEANDMMTVLESRLGYRLRNTHIETSALRAGKLRARQLEIAPDDPVLRVDFTPHDIEDRPLMHAQMFFRGDAFRYRAVVKR